MTEKLDISLRPSKSTGQTQLDVLRDVIVQIFSLSYDLYRGTKISLCNELESKVIKMGCRILHFTENRISKNVYLIHGKQRL